MVLMVRYLITGNGTNIDNYLCQQMKVFFINEKVIT